MFKTGFEKKAAFGINIKTEPLELKEENFRKLEGVFDRSGNNFREGAGKEIREVIDHGIKEITTAINKGMPRWEQGFERSKKSVMKDIQNLGGTFKWHKALLPILAMASIAGAGSALGKKTVNAALSSEKEQ